MKSFQKQDAPDVLRKWIGSNRTWNDFAAEQVSYQPVKQKLLQEQNCLCCYCESAISDIGSHIEHYEPRSRNPNRTFEYTNLACSCNGGTDKDQHCGHKKGSTYDHNLFVNPSLEGSECLFSYNVEGGIDPAPDVSANETQRVDYMVRTLNLDCARLTGMRRAHGRGIVDIINGFIEANDSDQLKDMGRFYLIPDENEKLQPFFSLSYQLFGKIASEIDGER